MLLRASLVKCMRTWFLFHLPVVQSVTNVHVVGKLFPQGRLQLTLRLDGLQGLTQLTLSDLL